MHHKCILCSQIHMQRQCIEETEKKPNGIMKYLSSSSRTTSTTESVHGQWAQGSDDNGIWCCWHPAAVILPCSHLVLVIWGFVCFPTENYQSFYWQCYKISKSELVSLANQGVYTKLVSSVLCGCQGVATVSHDFYGFIWNQITRYLMIRNLYSVGNWIKRRKGKGHITCSEGVGNNPNTGK